MRDGEKFRLGELCSITKGETPIKQAIPGLYPLVVTAAQRASHEAFQFDCRAAIVPLVSSTGHGHASIKRISYQEGKFALGSILCAVIPKDEKRLSAKFLHVYFSYFKDQLIVPLMKGSANVSLSLGALADLKIIVPPMGVQQRVISLAENEALMKPLEHEITHQETLLAKLKQAILQEAIAGKLTADWRAAHPEVEPASQLLHRIQAERARLIAAKKLRPEKPLPKITPAEIPFEIPQGWEWCRFGSYARFERGKFSARPRNDKRFFGGPYPFIQIGSLDNHGSVITSFTQTLNDEGLAVSKMFEAGTLAVAIVGGTIGNLGVLGRDMCFTDSVVGVRPNQFTCQDFILTMLRYMQPVIQSVAYQRAGQPNISLPNLTDLLIPLPPLAEQSAIVARVESLMQHCRALAAEIAHTRTHAAHLLQAVLKEAFAPAS